LIESTRKSRSTKVPVPPCVDARVQCSILLLIKFVSADPLRIKCDALLYRSVYHEHTCYFSIDEKIDITSAKTRCSEVLNGAKISTSAQAFIWNSMFLNRSRFHSTSMSSDKKAVLCSYVSPFKCKDGDQSSVPGKCIVRAQGKMNYKDNGIGAEMLLPRLDGAELGKASPRADFSRIIYEMFPPFIAKFSCSNRSINLMFRK
ncbi:hypothetical protein PFISCL1PPCAC_11712, partial [Pristionchus fissidentatus]